MMHIGYVVMLLSADCIYFFFFNDTATTEIYTLSLHDALPISLPRVADRAGSRSRCHGRTPPRQRPTSAPRPVARARLQRSEEHTSELQSRQYLVCRLLLEKKNIRDGTYLYQTLFSCSVHEISG